MQVLERADRDGAHTTAQDLGIAELMLYSWRAKSRQTGQSMRVTIGKVSMWSIPEAQAEARRLQIIIDNGDDPRQVKSDKQAAKTAEKQAKETEVAALLAQETREAVTLGMAWDEYLIVRKPFWGERHYADHVDAMQIGGEIRKRSHKLTEPGTLASFNGSTY